MSKYEKDEIDKIKKKIMTLKNEAAKHVRNKTDQNKLDSAINKIIEMETAATKK